MIHRSLIVPYRKHTLRTCDEIIRQASGIKRSTVPKQERKQTASDTHREWIDACLNEAKKPLTDKEQNFLMSISDQLTMRGKLKPAQIDWLEDIYTEKT